MIHKLKKNSHGAVMIEFAIVLPLLALLAIGVAELGTAFFALSTLHKAARVGARYINYIDETPGINIQTQIQNKVTTVMNGLPEFYTGTTTTPVITTTTVGGIVHNTVTVRYNHQLILGSLLGDLSGIFSGTNNGFTVIPLTAIAHMRDDGEF